MTDSLPRSGGRIGFVELLPPGARPIAHSNGVAGLRAARRLGCETVVITAHRHRLEPAVGELVDTWISCDTTTADTVADAVAGQRFNAFISWVDPFAGIAQQVATRLHLDTANPDWPYGGWNNKAAVRARQSAGVHDVVCRVAAGENITATGSNTDRLCYVLASGETRYQSRQAALNAAKKIEITVVEHRQNRLA